MNGLKKLLFVVCTAAGSVCSAQTFTTPEVFSFKQEVFRPISYYTGQANISIPLTQIQTPEITVPVSLAYVGGGGLRAINPYSNVGMGWKISAGGAITRTKNGVCDETTIATNGTSTNGFFSLPANSVTNSYVRNNVSSYIATAGNGTVYFSPTTEYSPDIFSFSFLGYSGYFLRGYDGEFKIQSQDIALIEKIDAPWSWPGQGNCVAFRLTANDGTKFTFGSTSGSIEFSGGNGPGVPYQCEAWYLTKIESTNGRIITFNYQPNSTTFVRYRPSSATFNSLAACPVVLDNITFNGGQVVFSSSTINQQITDEISYPRIINKVELKDANNLVINTANFTYSTESLLRYYLLDDVTVDGKKYLFGYYNRGGLPASNVSFGADFWGFYNGQPEVASLAPGQASSNWDLYLNSNLTLAERGPSAEHAKRGILTSVTYPTGGVESYEYEANTYSYKGVQTLAGTYYSPTAAPTATGGVRIKQITLGNMVRKYKYVTTFDPDNPDNAAASSSGILYRLPGMPYYGTSVLNSLSIDGEPPIVYAKVIEFLTDKSYTEYSMRSPLDKPDGDNNQNAAYYLVWSSNTAIFTHHPQIGFVGSLGKNSSRSLERGQVGSIKVYDAANTLKKSTEYIYATDPNRYNQNVAAVNIASTADNGLALLGNELGVARLGSAFTFSIFHSYEIYTFPVYLEQEVETSYENGNIIQRTTQYQYNAQKLRSATTTTNSTGDVIKTVVKYPADINTGIYATMVTKKMLNYPVEQVQFQNSMITGAGLTTYKVNGSSYVADKKHTLEIISPFAESGFTYFNGTTKDSRYGTVAEISYDTYSTNGNVTQITTKDGIVTAYLWDATDIYPMAQVKGANYSQINSQNAKPANYSSNTLFTSLSGLVPSAIINTYSYKPLVGIISATDVRGRATYYNYDQFNRLALIRDHDNNILKKYCYNYQGQTENCDYYGNQVINQTKRRNNCTGCQIGSSVTYSVPANTYYATTQSAANTLAQDDINANAQNYANANGTCSSPVMTSLISSNLISNKSFSVVFVNNCTGTNYSYTLNQNTINVTLSPQLPTGNYNITFTPAGGTGNYGYMAGDFGAYGTIVTIQGVDLVAGSNQVRVYP